MTTIAYDGNTLAGDRMGEHNGTTFFVSKIWSIVAANAHAQGHVLLGGSGSLASVVQWRDWIKGYGPKPEWDSEAESFTGMLITRDRHIWLFHNALVPIEVEQQSWAIGSGRDTALGAMAAGCTAARAVSIAAMFDLSTGNGVDVLCFPST